METKEVDIQAVEVIEPKIEIRTEIVEKIVEVERKVETNEVSIQSEDIPVPQTNEVSV